MEVIVQDVKPDISELSSDRQRHSVLADENNVASNHNSGQLELEQHQKYLTTTTSLPGSNNTIRILTQQQAKSASFQHAQYNTNIVSGGGGTVYITGGTSGVVGGSITSSSPVRTSTILTTTSLGQQVQTMAKSSGLSIVHVTLPQSVIQSPSVIQSASGQIKGNVILVSKPSGVIQTTGGALQTVHLLEPQHHLHSDESISNDGVDHPGHHRPDRGLVDRKRRDILTRRPSYRKILNDLGGAEISGERADSSPTSESSQDGLDQSGNLLIGGQQYPQSVVKVLNANTLGLSGGTTADNVPATSLQTITMTNAGTGGTIVQYSHPDGQPFYVPVGGELQTYTIRPVSSASSSPSVVVHGGGHHVPEEATRKREIRLLKNREAARECRRKKKEYIKCLENRVAVLENQNKALIDELKSLKELYCQQKTE